MTEEIWKDVVGYEGIYQISNLGRVKSLDRVEEVHRLDIDKIIRRPRRGRILKQKLNQAGYFVLHFRNTNGNGESWPQLHRLLGIAFLPNPENKPTINHKDGVKTNNSLDNLEWATMSENTQHAYDMGLAKSRIKDYSKSGEENHNAKLTYDLADKIREDRASGMVLTSIAEKYNLGTSTVHRVCTNQRWVRE